MANEIKTKITLEGEKAYKQALAEINRQLRESQSAVRAAAAEYQAADGATRTTAEQTDALTQMLERQREKLALMQAQLTHVEEQYGANSREAVLLRTNINATRAEMAKTQTQLRGLADSLEASADASESLSGGMADTAGGLDKIGESAGEATQDVRGLAGEIGDVIGQKVIEFAIGQKALDALKAGLSAAIGEAVDSQMEHSWMLANAGSPELAAAREGVQANLDKRWAGRMDGMATAAAVTSVDTAYGNMSLTDAERLTELTSRMIGMQEAGWGSVSDMVNRSKTMVNAFGITAEEALDLMTRGYQDSADGGSLLNTSLERGSQLFHQLGYDADDMVAAMISATQNDELGRDGNLVKGAENLIDTLTSGSDEAKQALQALGIEATDLPVKFTQGGETAAAAVQLILQNLMAIDDAATRDALGKSLFGDGVWTQTGGDIATALLAGYDQTIRAEGAASDAAAALTDNITDAAAGAKERISQIIGGNVQPIVDMAKDAVQGFNQAVDDGLLDAVTGPTMRMEQLIAQQEQAAEQAGQAAADAVTQAMEDAQPIDIDKLLGDLTASGLGMQTISEELRGALDEAAAAAIDAGPDGGTELTLDDLVQMREGAIDADNIELAQLLDAMITRVREDALLKTGEAGTEVADAAIDAVTALSPRMEQTAGDFAQEAVDAIVAAEDDAYDAGDALGGEGKSGTQDGLGDGSAEGAAYGQGVADGIESKIDDVYRAGQRLGAAGGSGLRNTLQIKSPSRVGMMLGGNFGGAVADGALERERDAYDAGAAIAEALEDGYDARGSQAYALGAEIAGAFAPGWRGQAAEGDAAAGAQESQTQAIAMAVREALEDMGLYMDGERVGRLTAHGVSREIAAGSARTASGRGAQVRSW